MPYLRKLCKGVRVKRLQDVLNRHFERFELEKGKFFWRNARLFVEFSRSLSKHDKAKESANHRWNKEKHNANAMPTHSERNANQNQNQNQNHISQKKKQAQAPFIPPEWINQESWTAYEEMRKEKKKVPTPKARALVVKELEKLRDAGNDPNECLDQSTRNGYTDVYSLKEKSNGLQTGGSGGRTESPKQRRMREAAAEADRNLGILPGGSKLPHVVHSSGAVSIRSRVVGETVIEHCALEAKKTG